jgi:hypothetical protein
MKFEVIMATKCNQIFTSNRYVSTEYNFLESQCLHLQELTCWVTQISQYVAWSYGAQFPGNYCYHCDGVKVSLWNWFAVGPNVQPQIIHKWIWCNNGMILMGEELKDSEKNLSRCLCIHHKSYMDWPVHKPGCHSYGTVQFPA